MHLEDNNAVSPEAHYYTDRVEALRRIPSYQSDWKEWERLSKSFRGAPGKVIRSASRDLTLHEKKMCSKWKLRSADFPPPPHVPLSLWEENRLYHTSPFAELDAVTVLSPLNSNSAQQTALSKLIDGYEPVRLKAHWNVMKQQDKQGKKAVTIEAGKHICFIIDVTQPELDCLGIVRGHLRYFNRKLLKPKQRNRSTAKVDLWYVYDQRSSGKGSTEIARHYLKRDSIRSSGPDCELNAYISAVNRAYDKAKGIIEALNQSLSS